MATTTEKAYVFGRLDEIEPAPILAPGATDDGRERLDVRRNFDITSFGIQAYRAPSDVDVVREHDEIGPLGSEGQEELYIVLNGSATFEIDGEAIDAPARSMVLVRPAAKRKAVAKEDGTTVLIVGGTPGEAFVPPPPEAGEAFAAYNKGEYETALAKQLVVVEKRPDDPVARFNAGCFAARAGQADEAIEHLQRAVEMNERVKDLLGSDEDLDSLREDPRFEVLAK
jgi:tetratricopeptide (TPR) repeat protein